MASFQINDNHRRALEAALHQVEQTLDAIVQLVHEAGPGSQALPAKQKQELLEKIAVARKQAETFRVQFKIPKKRPRDLAWKIQIGVSRLWEILEDCKADKIRGYGEVPTATKPTLDAEVQQLIRALQNIAAAARSKR